MSIFLRNNRTVKNTTKLITQQCTHTVGHTHILMAEEVPEREGENDDEEEEEEEGETEVVRKRKRRRRRRKIVYEDQEPKRHVRRQPGFMPQFPPVGYHYTSGGQIVPLPAKSEPCISTCTCCLLLLVLLLVLLCVVSALWLYVNWPDVVGPGTENPFPVKEQPPPAVTVPADNDARVAVPPRTRVIERLNVPSSRDDRYVIRKGDLVPTRNLTSLELYDMAVAGVPVADVFYRMDAFHRTLSASRRPLCLAHHQLKLSLFTKAENVVYRETGLSLVSVYLGNTTVHMINARSVGQRNNRFLRSDVASMRRPDRKRHMSYPETGWFEFVDADTESEESPCYDGKDDCERVTTTLRLRGYVAFCVYLAQEEMGGTDPFFR